MVAVQSSIFEELHMIKSFGDSATADLFHNRPTRRTRRFPPTILHSALRKLDVIEGAHRLQDLQKPPGNRLEALKGDLQGYYSIRVNDQWRIIFQWSGDSAHEVSLTDYHR